MMENPSYDHCLCWVPGSERQAGLTYFDDECVAHETYQLALDSQGCRQPDPRVRPFWDADLTAVFPPGAVWDERFPEPLLLDGTVEDVADRFLAILDGRRE